MKFLYIGSHDTFSRHELGFISALNELGKVDIVVLSSEFSVERYCIGSDNGKYVVTVYNIPCNRYVSLDKCIRTLEDVVEIDNYDLIIATPRLPILITYKVFGKEKEIILRLWSIRAAKLRDNLRFGAHEDIGIFIPSIAANLIYMLSSTYSITVDHHTYSFALKLYPFLGSRVAKIYPPYGFRYAEDSDDDKYSHILDLAERGDYILGFTSLNKTGPYLKFEAKPHAVVLYLLAKKTEMDIVLAGSTYEDWKQVLPYAEPPKNLHIVGRGFGDDIVRKLYQGAKLVAAPITNKNISNRLLESLFYGTPTITTDVVKAVHPELKHEEHVYISSWDNIVEETIKLMNSDEKLEILRKGAIGAYNKLFSTKVNVRIMKKLIQYIKMA